MELYIDLDTLSIIQKIICDNTEHQFDVFPNLYNLSIFPILTKTNNNQRRNNYNLMRKLNREIVCSGFITLLVCNLGEPSYLYAQVQKGLFIIPKIADSS